MERSPGLPAGDYSAIVDYALAMIHTILLLCAFGPGGCGAAGDTMNMTRPEDLWYLHEYHRCVSKVYFDPNRTYSMAEMRYTRSKQCGKNFKFIGDIPGSYHGPLIDGQTEEVLKIIP